MPTGAYSKQIKSTLSGSTLRETTLHASDMGMKPGQVIKMVMDDWASRRISDRKNKLDRGKNYK